MAKSKNGGSRAFIRGRIGSDVYSVGKDGAGKRQQVVRSLAVQVANPRTSSQMFGRMIMTTVMQAVSAMSGIIDHSFDGVAKGQPSISEFIRRNYALIKADAIAHPASGNHFGLNKYQEKGIKVGAYQISEGALVKSAGVTCVNDQLAITFPADNVTVGGLKAAHPELVKGYITLVNVGDSKGFVFFRVSIKEGVADSTELTTVNMPSIFKIESNIEVTMTKETTYLKFEISPMADNQAYGLIVSDYVNGSWQHSACTLSSDASVDFNANTALPTYPTGTEQFLNGGDL